VREASGATVEARKSSAKNIFDQGGRDGWLPFALLQRTQEEENEKIIPRKGRNCERSPMASEEPKNRREARRLKIVFLISFHPTYGEG